MAEIPGPPEANRRARLLVVDDDSNMSAALGNLLSLTGYQVEEASCGPEALTLLESAPYDLMLIDTYTSGMDGCEVIRRARKMCPDLSIIVLTAHPTLESAIAAVKLGAADYMLKPFNIEDLAATISEALQERAEELRRQQLLDLIGETLGALDQAGRPAEVPSSPPPTTPGRFLHAGSITLDRQKRLAVVEGIPDRTVELTEREAAILTALMERADQVLSCKQLAYAAMGYDLYEKEAQSLVRPCIFRLRRKIEATPSDPHLIRTVRGRGYFLSAGGGLSSAASTK